MLHKRNFRGHCIVTSCSRVGARSHGDKTKPDGVGAWVQLNVTSRLNQICGMNFPTVVAMPTDQSRLKKNEHSTTVPILTDTSNSSGKLSMSVPCLCEAKSAV